MRKCRPTRRTLLKGILTTIGIGAAGKAASTEVQADSSLQTDGQQTPVSSSDSGMIDASVLARYGVSAGEQIRVSATDDAESYACVLDTVTNDLYRTGGWNAEDACDRLGVPTEADLAIEPFAPHPEYTTRDQAEEHDEFVEYLQEGSSELVTTAPHGGRIEYQTERQSHRVAEQLDATDWGCIGFNSGGGAYDRWHITSTELSPRSFPKLDQIADREFTHGVSFHGFGEDGIAVGGGASQDLKQSVCQAIEDATDHRYEVYIPPAGNRYAGTADENYVNWLAADGNGIQIEQSIDARREDWEVIADAVVSVFE